MAKNQLFPIRPPTSPTTLIGGLAFPTKGGKAAPTVVTRSPKDSFGGEFLPSISSSSSLTSPWITAMPRIKFYNINKIITQN